MITILLISFLKNKTKKALISPKIPTQIKTYLKPNLVIAKLPIKPEIPDDKPIAVASIPHSVASFPLSIYFVKIADQAE